MGIKVAYIKYKRLCLQINRVYAIVRKWKIEKQFQTKYCVKLAATLTLASTNVFFLLNCDKNDTSWGTLGVSFPSKMSRNFLTSFYYYLKSTKHIASLKSYILSCMCLWHTYEISSRSVDWLFLKTIHTDKRSFWSENSKVT